MTECPTTAPKTDPSRLPASQKAPAHSVPHTVSVVWERFPLAAATSSAGDTPWGRTDSCTSRSFLTALCQTLCSLPRSRPPARAPTVSATRNTATTFPKTHLRRQRLAFHHQMGKVYLRVAPDATHVPRPDVSHNLLPVTPVLLQTFLKQLFLCWGPKAFLHLAFLHLNDG